MLNTSPSSSQKSFLFAKPLSSQNSPNIHALQILSIWRRRWWLARSISSKLSPSETLWLVNPINSLVILEMSSISIPKPLSTSHFKISTTKRLRLKFGILPVKKGFVLPLPYYHDSVGALIIYDIKTHKLTRMAFLLSSSSSSSRSSLFFTTNPKFRLFSTLPIISHPSFLSFNLSYKEFWAWPPISSMTHLPPTKTTPLLTKNLITSSFFFLF